MSDGGGSEVAGRAVTRSKAEEAEEVLEVEEWLVDLTSADPGTRSIAAFALGGARVRRRQAVAALRTALADADPVVADFAAQSLGMLGDTDSLPPILRLMSAGRPRDHWGPAWAAAELGARANDAQRRTALAELSAYRARARGRTRVHAEMLIARLQRRVVTENAEADAPAE